MIRKKNAGSERAGEWEGEKRERERHAVISGEGLVLERLTSNETIKTTKTQPINRT